MKYKLKLKYILQLELNNTEIFVKKIITNITRMNLYNENITAI